MSALDDDQLVAQARALRDRRMTFSEIAARLGVHRNTVGRLLTGDPLYGRGAKERAERAAIRLAPVAPVQHSTPAPSRRPSRPLPLPELGRDQAAGLGIVFQLDTPRPAEPAAGPARPRASFVRFVSGLIAAMREAS